MDIKTSRKNLRADELQPLVFTSINDVPENTRLGLGYHQLYDPSVPVPLIAHLPDVKRIDDIVTLFWDGVQVQQYLLDQPTIDKGWLSFSVPPLQISGGNDQGEVYYTLYDPSAGETRTSPVRTIAVNRLVPGGLDPDTLTGVNENLALAIIDPRVISSVDTQVNVEVPVWEHMAIGDELTVIWSGVRVDHPKLTSIGASQRVLIPRVALEQGGSNPNLPVSYEIRDIVDNYSLPSLPSFADVDIDPAALTAPRVREADPDTLELDLTALGTADAHVLIPNYSGAARGDLITLTWTGKLGATETVLTLGPEPVGDPDFDPKPVFDIPNAHLKSIAGGSAITSYVVLQANGLTRRSRRAAITLTGVVLEAATVREANGTLVIDLEDIVDGKVHVIVKPWLGKNTGDKISLIWTGFSQNGTPVNYAEDYFVKPGEDNSDHAFEVDRANLDPLLDSKLTIKYQVTPSGGTSSLDSPATTYDVTGAADIIDDFSTHTGDLISAGGSVSTPNMTIRFVSGTGRAGFAPGYVLPPEASANFVNPVFQVSYANVGAQVIEIEFFKQCMAIVCDVHGVESNSTAIRYLDANKAPLHSQLLEKLTNQQVSYTSTGNAVRYMEITSQNNDWTLWDNFVMKGISQPAHSSGKNLMTQITEVNRQALSAAFALASFFRSTSALQNPNFPAPTVTQAPGGTLNPLLGSAGVQVEVGYPSMVTSDIIGLSFNGDETLPPVNGSIFQKVTFNVPVAYVAASIGKTVPVIYAVVRPDGTTISETLNLQVQSIPAAQLPAPQITQAVGAELNVSGLTADADVTVAAWPLMLAGQLMWLRLEGSNNLDLPAWQAFPITGTGPQTAKVPLSYLQGLADASALRLILEVSFDNGATRQVFPVTSYAIKNVPAVIAVAITNVKDSRGNTIPNGGSTTDTSVTIEGTVALG
ncbi:MAG: hypothetical protein PW896_07900 [Pseudomonas sp.]|uniref:hypothetical protein n=1 Tax=Pseudomonas sp. TaxID=306 RepID=UPI002397A6BE|nr:hypothetical protein [Pseudomonas sp.]MDE1195092.1 hypothetical protein [Pseudomonas sp.]